MKWEPPFYETIAAIVVPKIDINFDRVKFEESGTYYVGKQYRHSRAKCSCGPKIYML